KNTKQGFLDRPSPLWCPLRPPKTGRGIRTQRSLEEAVMGNLSERQIRWILVCVGAGAFVLLRALDVWFDTDPFDLPAFLVDTVQALLVITSAVGVALLVQRMQKQHEEKMTLLRDLDTARAEGAGWRAKVQASLAGIKVEMDRQFEQWGMTAAE